LCQAALLPLLLHVSSNRPWPCTCS
jgi:hypothetical protein